ncbi:MAG: polysaccharide deacetylase family protein [Pedobacter sp.]
MQRPLKSEALRLFASGLFRLGINGVDKFRIVTFHSIQYHPNDKWHTSPKVFESQMRFLSDSGYRTCRISDIVDQWPDILRSQEKTVALTFDDGLLNNFTIVAEILSKFNMRATFFISTENIGAERTFPVSQGLEYFRDTMMLCWDDIRVMQRSGFEIGSHAHSHDMIAKMPSQLAHKNIAASKRVIETELNTEIVSFAYPYGHKDAYAKWTGKILRDLGFRAACTQMGGALTVRNDLFELPRIGIKGSDSLDVFKHKVSGAYDFLRWL